MLSFFTALAGNVGPTAIIHDVVESNIQNTTGKMADVLKVLKLNALWPCPNSNPRIGLEPSSGKDATLFLKRRLPFTM